MRKTTQTSHKQLYLRRTQIDNLICMQKPTTQCHSKKNTPYSQILRVKIICSTNSELERICKLLQEQFTKRAYD